MTNQTLNLLPLKAGKEQRKVGLKAFEMLSVIGKGGYDKVYLVRKKPPLGSLSDTQHSYEKDYKKNLFAMKVLKKATIVVHGKSSEQPRTSVHDKSVQSFKNSNIPSLSSFTIQFKRLINSI